MPPDIALRPEVAADGPAVDRLYAAAFGPGRFSRTAYRLRGARPFDPAVSFVAERRGFVLGAIRQNRVRVGGAPAYLLGPLAVAQTAAKQGIGRALMAASLDAARAGPAVAIVLIGDAPFYSPLGFDPAGGIVMPEPVEPHRLLAMPLQGTVSGRLDPAPWLSAPPSTR